MGKLLLSCVALPFVFVAVAAYANILADETGVHTAGTNYNFVILAEGQGTGISLAGDLLPFSSTMLTISLRSMGVSRRRASVQRVPIV